MSELEIERESGRLSLHGELDLAGVGHLESEVTAVRDAGIEDVLVDLGGLEFMDSSGLRCLVQLDSRAREEGWRLSLRPGPPAVHRVFELTRMDERLTFVEPG